MEDLLLNISTVLMLPMKTELKKKEIKKPEYLTVAFTIIMDFVLDVSKDTVFGGTQLTLTEV